MTHRDILKKLDHAMSLLGNCEAPGPGGVFPPPIRAALILGELRGDLNGTIGADDQASSEKDATTREVAAT